MKKRITCILVAFTLLLGFYSATPVRAEVSEDSMQDYYVVTEDVPMEVYEHIQNSIVGMVKGSYDVNEITVSKPFKLYNTIFDLYYSLIWFENRIVGAYRSYEIDGRYTGIYSEADEMTANMETVLSLTSLESPVVFVSGENEDIFALINGTIYTILEDPTGETTSIDIILPFATYTSADNVINISEGVILKKEKPLLRVQANRKMLDLDLKEKQGDLPWCVAYCTASIIRYKTGLDTDSVNVYSIMEWAYPNMGITVLKNQSLDQQKAVEYANKYGLYPTYTLSTKTYSQIVREISKGNPITFHFNNLLDENASGHAMVCRGYDDNSGNSYYSVWNPWNRKYEKVYASDNIYSNSNGTIRYEWTRTTYGWE